MIIETAPNCFSPDLPKASESSESPISKMLQNAVTSLDRYIERHRAGLDSKPFKERQLTVFENIRNFLNNGETEGYIELPCAVGKTVLYTKFIDATRLKTLIVTDRILGINQTEEKLETFAEDLDVGKIYHAVKEFGREVTITTYDSLRINIKNGTLNPADFQLLVLDEFDRAGPKTTETIQKFTNSIKLGFSATLPYYTFLKEIHTMSIKEAVEEGLNCGFSVILAKTRVDLTNVPIDSRGEFDEIQLGKTINLVGINQPWVELYQEMFEGKFVLAYCAGIEHAKTLSELFAKNGIPAGFISGKNSPNEQREILSQFKNGEIKVLCSADILIRAYDEPKASIAFNIRPTFSPRVAKQRSGRVLRNDPDDSAKHAHIVDAIYETGNTKKLPISFAQIAGSAHITADKEKNDSWETAGRKIIPFKEEKEIIDNKEIDIFGLKIIIDAEEVLRVVREREDRKYEVAPARWMNASNLAKIYSKGRGTIVRIANEYRKAHPEWFNIYTVPQNGELIEFYSPELIEILNMNLKRLQPVHERWVNKLTIARMTRRPYYLIRRRMIRYRADYPQWVQVGVDNRGKPSEVYAPELVEKVVQEVTGIQPAPRGWQVITNLADQIGVERRIIKGIVRDATKKHPELIREGLDKRRNVRRFMSPRLVNQIKERLRVA